MALTGSQAIANLRANWDSIPADIRSRITSSGMYQHPTQGLMNPMEARELDRWTGAQHMAYQVPGETSQNIWTLGPQGLYWQGSGQAPPASSAPNPSTFTGGRSVNFATGTYNPPASGQTPIVQAPARQQSAAPNWGQATQANAQANNLGFATRAPAQAPPAQNVGSFAPKQSDLGSLIAGSNAALQANRQPGSIGQFFTPLAPAQLPQFQSGDQQMAAVMPWIFNLFRKQQTNP